jgi:predicted metalloprotease
MLVLNIARCASGTLLEMQASYFVMKSSHSGTPMASPTGMVEVVGGAVVVVVGVLVVVVVVVVAVLLAEVVLEELVVESEPPQAANRSAHMRESDRETKNLFDIQEILLKELRGNGKARA